MVVSYIWHVKILISNCKLMPSLHCSYAYIIHKESNVHKSFVIYAISLVGITLNQNT